MDKLEIVDFSNEEFHKIPKQDNPAFGDDECMMIVREPKTGRLVVLYIKPDPIEAVNSIAIVWDKDIAVMICENFEYKGASEIACNHCKIEIDRRDRGTVYSGVCPECYKHIPAKKGD